MLNNKYVIAMLHVQCFLFFFFARETISRHFALNALIRKNPYICIYVHNA